MNIKSQFLSAAAGTLGIWFSIYIPVYPSLCNFWHWDLTKPSYRGARKWVHSFSNCFNIVEHVVKNIDKLQMIMGVDCCIRNYILFITRLVIVQTIIVRLKVQYNKHTYMLVRWSIRSENPITFHSIPCKRNFISIYFA